MKMLAEAGQKVITTTLNKRPWGGQTEDAFDYMIGWTKKINGSWQYDYTIFDKSGKHEWRILLVKRNERNDEKMKKKSRKIRAPVYFWSELLVYFSVEINTHLKPYKKMKKFLAILLLISLIALSQGLYSNIAVAISPNSKKILKSDKKDIKDTLKYFDASSFKVMGKYHDEHNFHRLPVKYENIVRPAVWSISTRSAGISIRFKTNSPIIFIKWILANKPSITKMSVIGVSGLDLYCLINGDWQFVNSAIPTDLANESLLISEMDTTNKEFLLNLPLYNGVENIQLGIDRVSEISSSDSYIEKIKKPIVFYGTSITQGGNASRPGMVYTSIISRKLKVETINLGFSGNGKFEESIGQVLCEIDAKMYVIDCTPNSSPETIKNNSLKLVQQIRKCKPQIPILLVESIIREYAYFKQTDEHTFGGLKYIQAQNRELKQAYNNALKMGINELYYLECNDLIGSDHEATADGTHLTDLGHYRIADKIGSKIIEILKMK